MARKASRVGVTGPLAAHADGYREVLIARGYSPLSAANQVRLMAHVSRWLHGRGLGVAQFTGQWVEEFLADRRAAGYSCWLSQRGMRPLVRFLEDRGLAPVESASAVLAASPNDVLLEEYRCYLVEERGLAKSTIFQRLGVARIFLGELCPGGGRLALEGLSAAEVAAFVTAQCRGHGVVGFPS